MPEEQGNPEDVFGPEDHVVVDPNTNEKYTVTGNEAVRDALSRGYELHTEQPNFRGIVVRNNAGALEEVDPATARRMIASGSGQIVPYDDLTRDQERRVYDNPLVAGVSAAARGATFGLSDQAASIVDKSWGSDAERLRRQNPYADLTGEILGGGATLLATGGASSVGAAAARGTAALGFEAGGLATRVAAGVAAGGLEGAAFSVGKELSEAALQGRELDSAKITQALGHGFMLGGALGGALPVVGAGVRSAASKVSSIAEEAADRALNKVLSLPGSALPEGSLKEAALQYAAKKTLEGTGGNPATIRAILESQGTREAADSILSKEVPTILGKQPGALLPRAEQKVGVDLIRDTARSDLESSLAQVDTVSRGRGPDIANIARRAQEEVLAPLEGKVFGSPELSELRSRVADISSLKDYRVSFSGLHSISEELGALASKSSGDVALGLSKIESIISDEINRGVTQASKELGVDLASSIKTQSEKYMASKALSEALGQGIQKEAAGAPGAAYNTVKDLFSGNALTQLGAAGGAAVAGPAGAAVGTAIGAVANAAMNRIKTLYGDQMVSTALRALAEGSPARMSAMVDGLVGSSVATFLKKTVAAPVKAASSVAEVALRNKAGTANAIEESIRSHIFGQRTSTQPQDASSKQKRLSMSERVANAKKQVDLGGASSAEVAAVKSALMATQGERQAILQEAINSAPPDVAAVLKGQLDSSNATTTFLLSLIPMSSNQVSSLTPQAEQPRMSKSEVDALVTAMRVAADPLSVVDSLQKGTLSNVEVAALQATAPAVYNNLVTSVQAQLSSMEEPLPYKEAVQLSTLLGVSGDPSLDPSTMLWLQEAYAPSQQPQQQQAVSSAQPFPKRAKIDYSHSWELIHEEP